MTVAMQFVFLCFPLFLLMLGSIIRPGAIRKGLGLAFFLGALVPLGAREVHGHESNLETHIQKIQWHPETGKGSLEMQVHVPKGKKVYGPKGPGDTLDYSPSVAIVFTPSKGQEKVYAKISSHWPPASPQKDEDEIFHVYTEKFTVYVAFTVPQTIKDHIGKAIKTGTISFKGLCCSSSSCLPFEIENKLDLQRVSLLKEAPSEKSLPETEPLPSQALPGPQTPWIKVLYGFLGGLLLNIMPCVLPVLGLKLLSFSKNHSRSTFRKSCLFTALGIFISFLCLALVTWSLKFFFATNLGWGTQFQDPIFLGIIVVLMIVFSLSLLGFFSLPQPQIHSFKRHGVAFSSFLSGFLATLLATPCTAPFLGSSLSLIITQGYSMIFVLYGAIALGFAFPYFLALCLPVHKVLPKIAPWSFYIEKVLGALLLGSGCYFLWLLSFHAMPGFYTAVVLVLGGIGGIALPSLLEKIRGDAIGKKEKKQGVIISILSFSAFLGLVFFQTRVTTKSPKPSFHLSMLQGRIQWKPLTKKNIEKALEEDKVVFVNITASWCMVCILNNKVFYQPSIQKLLSDPRVVPLKGDLTQANKEIQEILHSYQRVGLPFNAIISRSFPQGIIFSELLSSTEIQKGIQQLRLEQATAEKTKSSSAP